MPESRTPTIEAVRAGVRACRARGQEGRLFVRVDRPVWDALRTECATPEELIGIAALVGADLVYVGAATDGATLQPDVIIFNPDCAGDFLEKEAAGLVQ